MDIRQMITLVQQAEAEQKSYYEVAAIIAEAQKESDAAIAESMGATSVAAVIRQST